MPQTGGRRACRTLKARGRFLAHHHHATATGWVLRLSLAATLGFTAFEVYAGLRAHSLALLSDAGHNFADAFALLLAAISLYWQQKPASRTKTFGYQRAEVLAAFVNALTLVLISLGIFWEAAHRLLAPEAVNSNMMALVAAVGFVLNLAIAAALHRGHRHDLNVRAAFLHMAGDALSALAVVAGALVMRFTGWAALDPLLSIIIGCLVLYSAWDVMRESSDILLEGMPRGLDLVVVARAMSGVEGVLDVHDLHVWTLGSKSHALSSHVLIDDVPPSESDAILQRINTKLCTLGIFHSTIQFEHVPCVLSDQGCDMRERTQR